MCIIGKEDDDIFIYVRKMTNSSLSNIYVYSPQEQTRTTEKIDRNKKKEKKNYKLNVKYKHLNNNRDNKL